MIEFLPAFLIKWITSFNAYAAAYPMVAGAISLWALGAGSWLVRDIPMRVWAFVHKQSTVEVTMISSGKAFHDFIDWFVEKGYNRKVRTIKYADDREDRDEVRKSFGYGSHWIWYKWRPIKMSLEQQDTRDYRERDKLTLMTYGRSHKVFDSIFKSMKKEKDTLEINKYSNGWYRICEQAKTPLSSICLSDDIKERVVKAITEFRDKREWYLGKGIPHHLGIMLYGPPGTGKTSLVRAVASELKYNINILNSSKLYDIENAFAYLEKDSLVVIEDIDSEDATHKRGLSAHNIPQGINPSNRPDTICRADDDEDDEDGGLKMKFSITNLSDILNAIDGITSSEGRVMFMTTNRIEALDPALIRPGRIDLMLNLDYADNKLLSLMLDKFYENGALPEGYRIMEKVSPAMIQQKILENLENRDAVIEHFGRR